ncbi:MAG: tetratricopeptide repeat protein [SAR324 cluster bacterium]|nr:tetratricopeptide repeat protein [SAR324 cluster bacterium]
MESAQWRQAAVVLERALRIDSSDAQLWNALAQVHLQQGHYQQAENFAKKSNFLAGRDDFLKELNELIIQNARKHEF